MTHLAATLSLLGCALAAGLPDDYSLPPAPGPFVGKAEVGQTLASGRPIVATTYFYWYDAATKEHIINGDGTDALTDHPPTLEGFSYHNVDWHARQLEDMIASGIDVALPVYWGEPSEKPVFGFSDAGLPKLVAARERLLAAGKSPPRVGMFYDTSTLQHNGKHYHADLTTQTGRLWFYGTIRDFFSLIPPEHRATIDGRPIVFLYDRAFAKNVDASLFPAAREMFRKDFGTDVYLVKADGWPGEADSVYQWGGALSPRILATAAVGPGYDHSAVPGRTPLVRKRLGGDFYRYSWEKLLGMPPASRPWLVHVETWSEFHEGTEICETKEYGRQYIDLTRHYADLFHAGKQIERPFAPPRPETISATPEKSNCLEICTSPADGPIVQGTVAGRRAWSTTENKSSPASRYMYFDVDEFFLSDGDEPVEVTIDYYDAGPAEFRFEYDSSDPALAGLAKKFRGGHQQPITGTKAWKTVTFAVPHARFSGGANGADFRLASVGADLSIARVAVRKVRKKP
jgi:hypothetical protein